MGFITYPDFAVHKSTKCKINSIHIHWRYILASEEITKGLFDFLRL